MRRVILPSIKPGVLAGALFAFILSWDEIVVTLFISKYSVYTLPRRMWNGIRENTDPNRGRCGSGPDRDHPHRLC